MTAHVIVGVSYQLESSDDLVEWEPAGHVFFATTPEVTQEFAVGSTGRYFRLVEANVRRFAPTALADTGYVFQFYDVPASVSFSPTGFNYTVARGNAPLELGTYGAVRNGDYWSVTLTRNDSQLVTTLDLHFTASAQGNVVWRWPASEPWSAAFVQTIAPPPVLRRATIHNVTGGLGDSNYTVDYLGGTSGTFIISAGSVGQGTYTYTQIGGAARLVMNYTGAFAGDVDDLILSFLGESGSNTPSTLIGSQLIVNTTYRVHGTFTYTGEAPPP